MWTLVTIGVVLVVAFGSLAWALRHRVNDTRPSRDEEEAAAAAHSRPLANVTVLRPGAENHDDGR